MKGRAVTALLFAGSTVWAAVTAWRAVPGFAVLAVSQTCFLVAMVESRRGRERPELVWASFALLYLGLALMFAALFGTPTGGRFWIVFAAVTVVLSPVVVLARNLFPRP